MKYFLWLLLLLGLLLLHLWMGKVKAPLSTISTTERLTIGRGDTVKYTEPVHKRQRIAPRCASDSLLTYTIPVDSIGKIVIYSAESDTLEVEYFLNIEHLAIVRVDTLRIVRQDSVVYFKQSAAITPFVYGAIVGVVAMGLVILCCF